MASDVDRQLCEAAERGDVAEVERSVAGGANPNAFEGTAFWMPLQIAAYSGHVAAVAALLHAGARHDVTNKDGSTPLMKAAWRGHDAVCAALLAAGADVHHTDNAGGTALHEASRWDHLHAARMLLEAGARPEVRNTKGELPIDLVRAAPAWYGALAV
jgi:ankyrin repeat protein